jgi:Zn-dependent M32 family carboxypeptidase
VEDNVTDVVRELKESRNKNKNDREYFDKMIKQYERQMTQKEYWSIFDCDSLKEKIESLNIVIQNMEDLKL